MAKVAVIGAGLIGRAWAMVFARAGWEVALYDAFAGVAEAGLTSIDEGLRALAAQGLADHPAGAAARVRAVPDMAAALDGASFVQENVPETVEAKRTIFGELDRLAAPDAILASSTSAIVASLFTEELVGRQRCLVAHPVNPPHLVPLVELVGSPWTAPDTIERAKAVYL
ncbi:MAG: 3-hydroxyacyl-CoA dehydrogenase, partial [Hyphomicrobiales bacterium]|nr:3-hydroxyacyl-CoA dehydrogenase [Hyphomicrobiales bacterium]